MTCIEEDDIEWEQIWCLSGDDSFEKIAGFERRFIEVPRKEFIGTQ